MNFKKSTPLTLFVNLLFVAVLFAQPSGGPYGPIHQSYELPEVDGTIYYVAPDGNSAAAGTSLNTPTTLEGAIAKVVTGDAIILRGGVYRTGDLELNQSIVMQPYKDEKPIVKGTNIASDWELAVSTSYGGRDLWRVNWPTLFKSQPDTWWRTQREGRFTPLHKFNNDMLFVDGRFLQSAGWYNELNDDNFYIDYENEHVYVAFDPTDKEIEITAHNQGLVITPRTVNGKQADNKGPVIRGITFTQYAFHVLDVEGYFPEKLSNESEHGKDVVGTVFENLDISYGGRVGAFVFGDNFVMRNCRISDTSTEGLYLLSSSDALLEKNIFTRNNIELITGYYPSAVKIFNQTYRIVVNDNLVIDQPESNGIWYDVGNVDGVFTNNWLEGIGQYDRHLPHDAVYPSRNAFFFEISSGVRVAGNVFVNNDHGMMILNAEGAEVYNNTFVNSMVVFGRTRRGEETDHFGWHISTGPGVHERVNHEFANNMMVAHGDYERPLVYIWQLENMCTDYPEAQLSTMKNNTYVELDENDAPLIWMRHRRGDTCLSLFDNLNEFKGAFSQYGEGSVYLQNYTGPLFQSLELGHFKLHPDFSTGATPIALPASIQEVLNGAGNPQSPGAYFND
jgi:parallel beta-helix repeat protein